MYLVGVDKKSDVENERNHQSVVRERKISRFHISFHFYESRKVKSQYLWIYLESACFLSNLGTVS